MQNGEDQVLLVFTMSLHSSTEQPNREVERWLANVSIPEKRISPKSLLHLKKIPTLYGRAFLSVRGNSYYRQTHSYFQSA